MTKMQARCCLLTRHHHHHHLSSLQLLPSLLFVAAASCYFCSLCLGFSLQVPQQERLVPGIWKLELRPKDAQILSSFILAANQNDDERTRRPPQEDTYYETSRGSVYKQRRETGESTSKRRRNDDDDDVDEDDDILLIKLNPDGSFRQCTENYSEGRWLSGQWKLLASCSSSSDSNGLLLALDRQYYGPPVDILLQGSLLQQLPQNETESNETSIATTTTIPPSLTVRGNVWTGKFMYPKRHSQFFELHQPPPLPPALISKSPAPKCVGTFGMRQAVATFSVLPESVVQPKKATAAKPKFQASDFYGRSFLLTVEPMATTKQQQQQQLEQPPPRPTNVDDDFRAMPIQFYSNNTFQALHTNKILRGRFGVTTTTTTIPTNGIDQKEVSKGKDELWFSVSLFGSGRSVRGSVFSEGIGLSHQDKRSYVGEILQHDKEDEARNENTAMSSDDDGGAIQEEQQQRRRRRRQQQRLFVSGSVTYGSDLGSDARPEPVGTFLLTEITATTTNDGDASTNKDGIFGLLHVEDDDNDDDEIESGQLEELNQTLGNSDDNKPVDSSSANQDGGDGDVFQ